MDRLIATFVLALVTCCNATPKEERHAQSRPTAARVERSDRTGRLYPIRRAAWLAPPRMGVPVVTSSSVEDIYARALTGDRESLDTYLTAVEDELATMGAP